MERIGESKLKPRRTRGTPAYYHRNRFALGAIITGAVLATAWAYIPGIRRGNQKIAELFSQPSQEDIDRRSLFNFAAPRSSKAIEQTIKERDQLFSER